jgi:hypothetical protein
MRPRMSSRIFVLRQIEADLQRTDRASTTAATRMRTSFAGVVPGINLLRSALVGLGGVMAARQKLGMPPASAAALRKSFPSLDAVEATAPGLIEMIIGAAQGDPEAGHKLEALLAHRGAMHPTVQ